MDATTQDDDAWPVGPKVDWRGPARTPERRPIEGGSVRLEPLDPGRHGRALYEASHGEGYDPHLWTYLFVGPFPDEAAFRGWLDGCARSEDPLFFAIVDRATGRPSGMASFMRITPGMGVIEIGNIWFAAAIQRTRQATEAIYLMARHAFDVLGYRRFEWKCDALNARSRRAAVRFGFTYEGTFRQHMVVKGRNRDTAWYAIIDAEWPRIKAGFERWLAAENFDAEGRQRVSLSELNRQGIARG